MSRHKLYFFEGRNTGVVARTAKEARARKKRGGQKIVAVREMTDDERERGLRGEWIRTRRDGKSPEQSRYGKGRGQGPPRKDNPMDLAPLNPKYKMKLDKAYGTTGGNRFRKVIVVEKETGKTVARIDVKTRDGRHGSEETRAKVIKDFALMGLRNNQHSIDATVYENPNGGAMARVSSKKKVRVSRKKAASPKRTKKTAVRRATKKRAVRRVSGPARRTGKLRVSKKTVVRKTNPGPVRYKLKVGNRYYDGAGLTSSVAKACSFTDLGQARKVGNALAKATGKQVAIHSNRAVKKK